MNFNKYSKHSTSSEVKKATGRNTQTNCKFEINIELRWPNSYQMAIFTSIWN